MPLTNSSYSATLPMGGGYMKGYVRWHEPAKRHYVGVYWQGYERLRAKFKGKDTQ